MFGSHPCLDLGWFFFGLWDVQPRLPHAARTASLRWLEPQEPAPERPGQEDYTTNQLKFLARLEAFQLPRLSTICPTPPWSNLGQSMKCGFPRSVLGVTSGNECLHPSVTPAREMKHFILRLHFTSAFGRKTSHDGSWLGYVPDT